MNIYDYIESPDGAVKKGYCPCYLTKVSAVINRAFSSKAWERHIPTISLDDSVKDFAFSIWVVFWMISVTVTLPVTCWIIAFYMPANQNGEQ